MSADSPRRSASGSVSRGLVAVPSIVPPEIVSDRSILDSAIGFINEVTLAHQPHTDPKDTITWARFETAADISDPRYGEDWELDGNVAPPLLLILGYGLGVQVWAIPANGEAVEVLSWRHGIVSALRVLPTPSSAVAIEENGRADEPIDVFAEKRPLIALVDGSASSGSQPQFCAVNFISLKTGTQVKAIKFKNPVIDVLANRSSIVITFHERIAVFDARTLEDRLSITTCYPSPGINPNPVALGPRWLAYAEQKLLHSKRSGGGCDGEGVASYTATVLNASKSLVKGLRELGEQVAAGLTGTSGSGTSSKNPSFDSGSGPDAKQSGIVTIIDIKNPLRDYSPTTGVPMSTAQTAGTDPIVAHFIAHSEALVAMEFDNSGMLLVTADRRGHDFHVFRIQPNPVGPSLAAVHHLYVLHRGDTSAKVQNITFSLDSRWVAVSTLRGTTHVFPITPYGGPMGVRTHTSLHVVNKLSRFHRSAGLSAEGRSNSPISHSESTTFSLSLQPYHNTTLPPYPRPTVVMPLAQLRQPFALGSPPGSATMVGGKSGPGGQGSGSQRQRLSSLSDDSGKPLSVCAIFAKSRSWLLDPPNVTREAPHRMQRKAVDSLFVMAGHGALIQYDLDTKLASNVAKEKICDDTPIELEVEAKAQWNLGRRKEGSQEIMPPLSLDNWLIKNRNSCMLTDSTRQYDDSDDRGESWLAQVEIVTHAGPHRRLWMGPQFVFKTYNTPSGSNLSHVDIEAVEIGTSNKATSSTTTTKPEHSSPLNMPLTAAGRSSAVPVLIESGSYSSIEQSPKLMDRFRHDHLDSDYSVAHGDTRLKEDLADAMRESPSVSGNAASKESGGRGCETTSGCSSDNVAFYDALAEHSDDQDQETDFLHDRNASAAALASALPNIHSYDQSTSYESSHSDSLKKPNVSIEKIVNPLGTVTTVTSSCLTDEVKKDILDEVVSQLAAEDQVIHENCDESLFRPVVAIFCDEKTRLKQVEDARKEREMCQPPENISNKLIVPVIAKEVDDALNQKEKQKSFSKFKHMQNKDREILSTARGEQTKFEQLSSLNKKSKINLEEKTVVTSDLSKEKPISSSLDKSKSLSSRQERTDNERSKDEMKPKLTKEIEEDEEKMDLKKNLVIKETKESHERETPSLTTNKANKSTTSLRAEKECEKSTLGKIEEQLKDDQVSTDTKGIDQTKTESKALSKKERQKKSEEKETNAIKSETKEEKTVREEKRCSPEKEKSPKPATKKKSGKASSTTDESEDDKPVEFIRMTPPAAEDKKPALTKKELKKQQKAREEETLRNEVEKKKQEEEARRKIEAEKKKKEDEEEALRRIETEKKRKEEEVRKIEMERKKKEEEDALRIKSENKKKEDEAKVKETEKMKKKLKDGNEDKESTFAEVKTTTTKGKSKSFSATPENKEKDTTESLVSKELESSDKKENKESYIVKSKIGSGDKLQAAVAIDKTAIKEEIVKSSPQKTKPESNTTKSAKTETKKSLIKTEQLNVKHLTDSLIEIRSDEEQPGDEDATDGQENLTKNKDEQPHSEILETVDIFTAAPSSKKVAKKSERKTNKSGSSSENEEIVDVSKPLKVAAASARCKEESSDVRKRSSSSTDDSSGDLADRLLERKNEDVMEETMFISFAQIEERKKTKAITQHSNETMEKPTEKDMKSKANLISEEKQLEKTNSASNEGGGGGKKKQMLESKDTIGKGQSEQTAVEQKQGSKAESKKETKKECDIKEYKIVVKESSPARKDDCKKTEKKSIKDEEDQHVKTKAKDETFKENQEKVKAIEVKKKDETDKEDISGNKPSTTAGDSKGCDKQTTKLSEVATTSDDSDKEKKPSMKKRSSDIVKEQIKEPSEMAATSDGSDKEKPSMKKRSSDIVKEQIKDVQDNDKDKCVKLKKSLDDTFKEIEESDKEKTSKGKKVTDKPKDSEEIDKDKKLAKPIKKLEENKESDKAKLIVKDNTTSKKAKLFEEDSVKEALTAKAKDKKVLVVSKDSSECDNGKLQIKTKKTNDSSDKDPKDKVSDKSQKESSDNIKDGKESEAAEKSMTSKISKQLPADKSQTQSVSLCEKKEIKTHTQESRESLKKSETEKETEKDRSIKKTKEFVAKEESTAINKKDSTMEDLKSTAIASSKVASTKKDEVIVEQPKLQAKERKEDMAKQIVKENSKEKMKSSNMEAVKNKTTPPSSPKKKEEFGDKTSSKDSKDNKKSTEKEDVSQESVKKPPALLAPSINKQEKTIDQISFAKGEDQKSHELYKIKVVESYSKDSLADSHVKTSKMPSISPKKSSERSQATNLPSPPPVTSAWRTLSGADMIAQNLSKQETKTDNTIFPSLKAASATSKTPKSSTSSDKLLPELPTPKEVQEPLASLTAKPSTSKKSKNASSALDDFPILKPLDALPPLPTLEPLELIGDEIKNSSNLKDISLINFESPLQENAALERKITPPPRGFTEQNLIFALCGSLHYENEQRSRITPEKSDVSPTTPSSSNRSSSALDEPSMADYKSLTENDDPYISLEQSSQDTYTTNTNTTNDKFSSSTNSSGTEEIIIMEEKKMTKKQKRKRQQQLLELQKQKEQQLQQQHHHQTTDPDDDELKPLIAMSESQIENIADNSGAKTSAALPSLLDESFTMKPFITKSNTLTHSTTTDSEGPMPATTSDDNVFVMPTATAGQHKIKTKKLEHKINLMAAIEAATSSSTSSAEESGVELTTCGRGSHDTDDMLVPSSLISAAGLSASATPLPSAVGLLPMSMAAVVAAGSGSAGAAAPMTLSSSTTTAGALKKKTKRRYQFHTDVGKDNVDGMDKLRNKLNNKMKTTTEMNNSNAHDSKTISLAQLKKKLAERKTSQESIPRPPQETENTDDTHNNSSSNYNDHDMKAPPPPPPASIQYLTHNAVDNCFGNNDETTAASLEEGGGVSGVGGATFEAATIVNIDIFDDQLSTSSISNTSRFSCETAPLTTTTPPISLNGVIDTNLMHFSHNVGATTTTSSKVDKNSEKMMKNETSKADNIINSTTTSTSSSQSDNQRSSSYRRGGGGRKTGRSRGGGCVDDDDVDEDDVDDNAAGDEDYDGNSSQGSTGSL